MRSSWLVLIGDSDAAIVRRDVVVVLGDVAKANENVLNPARCIVGAEPFGD